MYKIVENYFNFFKRFVPSSTGSVCIGLDIGVDTIKMIELKKLETSNNSFEIVSFHVEPIKEDDKSSAIKNCLLHASGEPDCVNTAIFGKGTLIRYIEVPAMSSQELKGSFSIEADKYFPFAIDQIYTDCYILEPKLKAKKMQVMAGAAKRELVDRRVSLLNSMDLPFDFIGINSVVLANLFSVLGYPGDSTDGEDKVVALLDMGESVSSLIIFVNSLPRFTRDVMLGGKDFTKRISTTLNISMEEAELLKRDAKDKSEQIKSVCELTLMNIVQELRLSFDYFTTEKNLEITQLFLTGGASRFQGMYEFIAEHLDVKSTTWDPFENIKCGPNVSSDDLNGVSFQLAVALGLALYNYD